MATKRASKKTVTKAAASPPKFEGEIMAFAAANYADDKKAEDIVILDMRGISLLTDYMVICSVSSMPQLRAVRDEVEDNFLNKHNCRPIAADRNLESLWIILHFGDVMVHVLHTEKREYYALEDLFNDAPRVEWPPVLPLAAKKTARKAAKKAVKKAAD